MVLKTNNLRITVNTGCQEHKRRERIELACLNSDGGWS